jgi:hypothetical protein
MLQALVVLVQRQLRQQQFLMVQHLLHLQIPTHEPDTHLQAGMMEQQLMQQVLPIQQVEQLLQM